MKINLLHLLFHTTCKKKNRIMIPLLIFAMVVTGIVIPRTSKAEEVTVSIYAHSWNFNIQDANNNILFETVGGELTQLNTEKIEYELWPDTGAIPPSITQTLHITGIDYFVINCKDYDSDFSIYIPDKGYKDILTIAGEKIIVSNNEITTQIPTTKIRWKKVKKAERYVLYRVYRYNGRIKRRDKLDVYKKATNCTVPDEKGVEYQIAAQRKIRGKWKTLRIFDITI